MKRIEASQREIGRQIFKALQKARNFEYLSTNISLKLTHFLFDVTNLDR